MARNRYFEDEELVYKFNKSSLKKALKYALPHKKPLIVMICFMIVMSFVALTWPLINSYIVDYVLTKSGYKGLDWVTMAVLLFTAWTMICAGDVVYTFFRTFFMAKVGHSMVRDIRRDAYGHLQKLAFDYYDSRPAGKILVRVTNYLDDLANIFSSVVVVTIVESVKVILICFWLFILDWRLALVVMVSIIPMAILIFVLRNSLNKRHRKTRNKVSNRTAYVAENIQGTFVTKAFNRSNTNLKIYGDLNDSANNAWYSVIHVNELFFPTLEGFFYIGLLAVYGVVIFMLTGATNLIGGLTIGKLVGFVGYMGMFSGPLNNIANVLQQFSVATSNLERVFEISETPPSVFDAPESYELPEVTGNVLFEDVTFGYEKHVNILEHFSLEVPAGKMIALVGPTGAGKSTVVNLLSRFYDIQGGVIKIDGHDISKVRLHSLRTQVGVMMQDSFVFSGTIMDNIRYARPDASDEDCIAAAKEAHAHEFITKMPEGYQTKTKEGGAGLSTGERQLLSFARVIVTDPRILILDEATSSIDTQTEEQIKVALDKILKGRTSFVIAHRLSTIRKADCILYIANKGIAEAGTHDQLMAIPNGRYRNLVCGHANNAVTLAPCAEALCEVAATKNQPIA